MHGGRQFGSSRGAFTLDGEALFGELPAFETNALVAGPLLSQAGELALFCRTARARRGTLLPQRVDIGECCLLFALPTPLSCA